MRLWWLVLVVGCAVDAGGLPPTGDPTLDAQPPEEDGGDVDMPGDPRDLGGAECAPEGALVCADGRLERCSTGQLELVRDCAPLACASDEARCARIDVSHVSDDGLLQQGTVALRLTGEVVVDTETGEVTQDGAVLRGPGVGSVGGVPFALLDQPPPGADLGVFVVRSLRIESTATVTTRGRRALVILVSEEATVAGTIDVGGNGRTAGPGGGAGGGRRQAGGGPGGGSEGDLDGILGDKQAGGGGGGHVLGGGVGGTDRDAIGGAGGSVISDPEGTPLVGGGGGGGGASVDDGGPGGGGGGAIQITAGVRIVIESSGIIRAPGAGGSRSGEGGGGGGAGGTVFLEAPAVTVDGTLAANGGGGGGGGSGSGDGARGGDMPDRTEGGTRGDGNGFGGFGGGGGGLEGLEGCNGNPGGGGGGAAGRVVMRSVAGSLQVNGTISVAGAARTTGTVSTL